MLDTAGVGTSSGTGTEGSPSRMVVGARREVEVWWRVGGCREAKMVGGQGGGGWFR